MSYITGVGLTAYGKHPQKNTLDLMSAAAASDEPPPIPDAMGRFFSSRNAAPGASRPACAASARAARNTRLSSSAPRPAAKRPLTISVSVADAADSVALWVKVRAEP